ncbi:pilus assembly protein TadE [Xanthomonas translucens pv. arrhenatheri]|uniref:TadE family protein n=1 Tax=Xanthomonas graminis pv. arrhenatheri LMG 727 TaxID=1195923 RepID=A0A0K2ZLY8_9XANT|nr:TadE family protein [Xanthomonas translucens]OAX67562.1 pilus assembly protein TadE [Xanthomonas translucens pv. arrhenatheri]UKE77941.1 pilus assembly protein [Xanthomonas translucens pv. arrhenatheri]CTP86623.1 TadE family protein [Xanthomonas translucens pv. arrhenatheri LMG 727]
MKARVRAPRSRSSIRGQSMVELVIITPVLLFLLLAVIQAVLLYRMKSTLDYAALLAARAGAVSGVDRMQMRNGLAKGMMPLYAHDTGQAALELAYGKALADLTLHGHITVINPTRAAWNNFRERQYDSRYALPNDTLAYRSDAVGSSGVNVQDANILKVKVVYDAPLVVPFVGWVLGGKSEYLKPDTFESSTLPAFSKRLPIESYAIVRMQSPIYKQGNLDQ